MRRAAAVALLVSACTTPRPWTGGLPPSGAGLSNDERMKEYGRYMPESLADGVHIREGSKLVHYTFDSYRPVLQALDPSIESRVAASHDKGWWAIPFVALSTYGFLYATRHDLTRGQRYGAIAGAATAFAAQKFLFWRSAVDAESALRALRHRLDKRLFP